MRTWLVAMMMGIGLTVSGAGGADAGHAEHGEAHVEPHRAASVHALEPTTSQNPTWAGALVIIIVGMFVAAAAVGVVVRANTPDEIPEPVSHHHDDHGHGSSDHH